MRKEDNHVFTGLQQDVAESKLQPRYLIDADNIRITANTDHSLLSITNEKGYNLKYSVNGTILGKCVLNDYLITFVHEENGNDTIYRYRQIYNEEELEYTIELKVLFPQEDEPLRSLNFSKDYPIETLGEYENEAILNVYWVDGLNQPRVINIVSDLHPLSAKPKFYNNDFNFVLDLKLKEEILVTKEYGSTGEFPAGTILYAFTYYNKYALESNIFHVTPIFYTSHSDRGGSPNETISNAFKIKIYNPDTNFDYLRIYSIIRTSEDATPLVRKVSDIKAEKVNDTEHTEYLNSAFYGDTAIMISTDGGTTFKSHLDPSFSSREEYIWTFSKDIRCLVFSGSATSNVVVKTRDYTFRLKDQKNPSTLAYHNMYIGLDKLPSDTPVPDNYLITCGTTREITVWQKGEQKDKYLLDAFAPAYYYIVRGALLFIDNGTSGSIEDPTTLLYKGGEEIYAKTLCLKDGTLFLGNIGIKRPSISSEILLAIKTDTSLATSTRQVTSSQKYNIGLECYETKDGLKYLSNTSGFKTKEYYRCGLLFQYKNGKWSEPVWVGDTQVLPSKLANYPSISNGTQKIVTLLNNLAVLTSQTTNEGTTNAETIYTLKPWVLTLYSQGYRKVRPVVVFPEPYERTVLCLGIVAPTMFTTNHRTTVGDTYALSSWFFRCYETGDASNGTSGPLFKDPLKYTLDHAPSYNQEIEGEYMVDNCFLIDWQTVTLHSPDIEFDSLPFEDLNSSVTVSKIGYATTSCTYSDIDIITSSPTISNTGTGFNKLTFKTSNFKGIICGPLYNDFLVDDRTNSVFEPYSREYDPVNFLVYPWLGTGSLNNDAARTGRTAVLLLKVISNLRELTTTYISSSTTSGFELKTSSFPILFNSTEATITKLSDNSSIYRGNVDTLIVPDYYSGKVFKFNGTPTLDTSSAIVKLALSSIGIPFKDGNYYKLSRYDGKTDDNTPTPGLSSIYHYDSSVATDNKWVKVSNRADIGNVNGLLGVQKSPIRMRYKSSPHLVLEFNTSILSKMTSYSPLLLLELSRTYDSNTMFGGESAYALKLNKWIPAGEAIDLPETASEDYTNNKLPINYLYGDTWFSRYDCLKTYAFSEDDLNQVIEIGSFNVESHINLDGRYDRNQRLNSNLYMSPKNFNLLNKVYSLKDNFFTARKLDEDYYNLNKFPNQITWSTQKAAGSEIDPWTKVTLASTYDLDGNKDLIRKLLTFNGNIYCFLDNGISNLLFNSRVLIPTSDSVPIEITNNYKLDGKRYLNEKLGCNNAAAIACTPLGIYFIDSTNRHLYFLGDQGLQDVSVSHNMSLWFELNIKVDLWTPNNFTTKLFYDETYNDLYIVTKNNSLVFSERLNEFTSFMSIYAGMYEMFNFLGSTYSLLTLNSTEGISSCFYKLWEGSFSSYNLTFLCNGIGEGNLNSLNKTFTNIDLRADVYDSDGITNYAPFTNIRVWDSYLDTDSVSFDTVARKKFKVWRMQIRRDSTHTRDRIQDTWVKVKLECSPTNGKLKLQDIGVTYFI